ncbi:zinc finger protein, putative [Babesia caballi]|uniref:Zinc finger protein, putative n=1 Tax=Babesia caballi TaxID=5871 RepID=A0AAV4LTU9_BABCB|nr:zinc finger protein, putative [Babesia caballi]
MLEYQREECSTRRFKFAAGLFCRCGTPFVDRYRHEPCHHVFCRKCAFAKPSRDKCPVCKAKSETLALLHRNDTLHICTVTGCDRGFLNFQSLRAHAKLAHGIECDSVDEFYSQVGDAVVQFGDVQKISRDRVHFAARDAQATADTGESEDAVEETVEPKAKRVATGGDKPVQVMDPYEDRQLGDDLEDLM